MKREKCIVCNNYLHLDSVIIGDQYPSAIFVEKDEDYQKIIQTSSLNLAKCSNNLCGLVQLSTNYNLDMVYSKKLTQITLLIILTRSQNLMIKRAFV